MRRATRWWTALIVVAHCVLCAAFVRKQFGDLIAMAVFSGLIAVVFMLDEIVQAIRESKP